MDSPLKLSLCEFCDYVDVCLFIGRDLKMLQWREKRELLYCMKNNNTTN